MKIIRAQQMLAAVISKKPLSSLATVLFTQLCLHSKERRGRSAVSSGIFLQFSAKLKNTYLIPAASMLSESKTAVC